MKLGALASPFPWVVISAVALLVALVLPPTVPAALFWTAAAVSGAAAFLAAFLGFGEPER